MRCWMGRRVIECVSAMGHELLHGRLSNSAAWPGAWVHCHGYMASISDTTDYLGATPTIVVRKETNAQSSPFLHPSPKQV
jgi:hypothetical protein